MRRQFQARRHVCFAMLSVFVARLPSSTPAILQEDVGSGANLDWSRMISGYRKCDDQGSDAAPRRATDNPLLGETSGWRVKMRRTLHNGQWRSFRTLRSSALRTSISGRRNSPVCVSKCVITEAAFAAAERMASSMVADAAMEAANVELKVAGLDTGDIKYVVDQREQVPPGLVDVIELHPLHRRKPVLPLSTEQL